MESIAGRALSSVEAVHWREAIAVATKTESRPDAQPVVGLEADDKAVDAEVEKLLEPAAAVGSEVSDRQPVLEPAAVVGSEVSDRQLEDELETLLNEGDDPYLIPSDDDDFEDDRMLSELRNLIGPPPKIEVKEEVSSPPMNVPIARSIAPAEKSIAFAPAPKSMSMPSAPSLLRLPSTDPFQVRAALAAADLGAAHAKTPGLLMALQTAVQTSGSMEFMTPPPKSPLSFSVTPSPVSPSEVDLEWGPAPGQDWNEWRNSPEG